MADIVNTNQFRNGMHIEVEGLKWRIVEFQHVKPGKGGAFVRNSTMRHFWPSTSMCIPFLNWFVLTCSAIGG